MELIKWPIQACVKTSVDAQFSSAEIFVTRPFMYPAYKISSHNVNLSNKIFERRLSISCLTCLVWKQLF